MFLWFSKLTLSKAGFFQVLEALNGTPPVTFELNVREQNQLGFWNISIRPTSGASFIKIGRATFSTSGTLSQTMTLNHHLALTNRPFSKMAPTEGGLETGGTACLHLKSGRGRFLQFLSVNIEMPHNCCVPFCNATSKKNKNLRFHRFPKKRGLKDQWIAKIRRDEGDYFAVTENTRVCSKHFCEEDYTVSEDGKGKKIVLKKGAVPTIFKWSSEKRSRSTFASKGKRKGEALEAPRKKRQ